jgi:hypothetical protein
VEVLTAFVPVHRLLHGACGLLLEGHLPYAGSVCQVMSVPAFGAVVLGMLIQKLEAPEGDGWSLESLVGRFSGATRPASHSDVKSMWRVTFGRLVCLGGWPPSSA